MSSAAKRTLRALLGDYPVTHAVRSGELQSPHIVAEFAEAKPPSSAFKRVVREDEFDVAELAIVTFLMARAHGKPLVLMPAVVLSRDQHPYLVYNAARGTLSPRGLAGKRVGIRSYSVTTTMWIRGILEEDFGVSPGQVRWISFEDCHVKEFVDPPNVERAAPGKDLLGMLKNGEVDAAILPAIPDDPLLKPVIADPDAAGRRWRKRHEAIQINHMVVARESLCREDPRAVREWFRLLAESRRLALTSGTAEAQDYPIGIENMRRSLEIAIDWVHRQGLISRRFPVDELFDETTRGLGG